jgi:catechol 2,3-dioxygenase-like lactoylglutathione lyase family enzyme
MAAISRAFCRHASSVSPVSGGKTRCRVRRLAPDIATIYISTSQAAPRRRSRSWRVRAADLAMANAKWRQGATTMLANEILTAFLATADAGRARAFFEGVLGLTFVEENAYLVMFETDSARLNLQKTDVVKPPVGTALGWHVKNLRESVKGLAARGVHFERFEGMAQDDLAIWSPQPGTGVAWFKDPDGNLLSLSQSRA